MKLEDGKNGVYIEPEEYFTPEMLKVAEKWDREHTKPISDSDRIETDNGLMNQKESENLECYDDMMAEKILEELDESFASVAKHIDSVMDSVEESILAERPDIAHILEKVSDSKKKLEQIREELKITEECDIKHEDDTPVINCGGIKLMSDEMQKEYEKIIVDKREMV